LRQWKLRWVDQVFPEKVDGQRVWIYALRKKRWKIDVCGARLYEEIC
jgi:hypothetical protein